MTSANQNRESRGDRIQRYLNTAMLILLCMIVGGIPVPFITFYYPLPYPVQTGIMLALATVLFCAVKIVKRK